MAVYAQTPTPTPDPDELLAQQYKMSLLEVKLSHLSRKMGEVREYHKAVRSGKVGTNNEVLINLTPPQKAVIASKRTQVIGEIKTLCGELLDASTK